MEYTENIQVYITDMTYENIPTGQSYISESSLSITDLDIAPVDRRLHAYQITVPIGGQFVQARFVGHTNLEQKQGVHTLWMSTWTVAMFFWHKFMHSFGRLGAFMPARLQQSVSSS